MPIFPPAFPPDGKVIDHTDLPETDGSFKQSFQEHFQAMLLSDTVRPLLDVRHPDSQYVIGQDSGIFFRLTDPPLLGCKAPDWYYIPEVPPLLEGRVRRSYVLWQELIDPVLIIEFASRNGAEERDATPETGKFWVYERVLRAEYYGIYFGDPGRIEFYNLVRRRYRLVEANERGHFPVEDLGVELGIWTGRYQNQVLPWLRFWDNQGRLLPTGEERADIERQRAEAEHLRAERLAARLRALGIDPDAE